MDNVLKPCPFCGKVKVYAITVSEMQPTLYAVECGTCGAYGPPSTNRSTAETMWDERKPIVPKSGRPDEP